MNLSTVDFLSSKDLGLWFSGNVISIKSSLIAALKYIFLKYSPFLRFNFSCNSSLIISFDITLAL